MQLSVLFLIHYKPEKHFKEGYIFSVFSSGNALSSNLAGFESQKFQNFLSDCEGALSAITVTKVNSNYKTEPSKHKQC